jgi:hypothetical protein
MHWSFPDLDDRLREVARMALRCCPQRVSLEQLGDVVVLSATEYARLRGKPLQAVQPADPEGPAGATSTADGPAQESAAAQAGDERKWVWEWDEETQSWALPWAKDVDPADHPGLEFLNFMQNSPLAQAFRDGDFTPDEWDAACRIGR